jgi:magnesium transporter
MTRLSASLDRPQPAVCQTTSLSVVLNCLEAALKKASRAKKGRGKQRQFNLDTLPLSLHHDYMSDGVLIRPASFGDLSSALSSVQGKQKEFSSGNRTPNEPAPGGSPEFNRAPKAWWLDVASPTWDDLQTIGKLLHIHPLTLEDILQQDPREKMELFSKLGYYFISFRTIQNAAVTQLDHQGISSDDDSYKADDGALRETNIYVVVFKEGICTFYFADVSEHIEKVRNRVQLLQDYFNMSSDWIAHGILDSVVDSFFPFLKEIEQQVLAVETLVFSSNDVSHTSSTNTLNDLIHMPRDNQCDSNVEKLPDTLSKEMGETPPILNRGLSLSRFTQPLLFRRLKCRLQNLRNTFATTRETKTQVTTTNTLLRMARARRLVTSLTRLLATKSEVISQIRKRFLIGGRQKASPQGNDDLEIAIYMGDVQDHILTLQQSLHHYERMLSDSHPAYLTQLRTHLAKTKQYTDKAILVLSLISIGVMCIQLPIGIFSENLKIPKNSVHPPGPYNYFMMVILLLFGIEAIFLVVVRRWWNQAKRTRSKLS